MKIRSSPRPPSLQLRRSACNLPNLRCGASPQRHHSGSERAISGNFRTFVRTPRARSKPIVFGGRGGLIDQKRTKLAALRASTNIEQTNVAMWILLDRLGEILIIALTNVESEIAISIHDAPLTNYPQTATNGGISAPGGGTIIRGNFVNAAASL